MTTSYVAGTSVCIDGDPSPEPGVTFRHERTCLTSTTKPEGFQPLEGDNRKTVVQLCGVDIAGLDAVVLAGFPGTQFEVQVANGRKSVRVDVDGGLLHVTRPFLGRKYHG